MATNLTRRADQPFMSLRDAMNQLFTDAFAPSFYAQGQVANGHEALPTNVYEDGEKYYLQLLAPGLEAEAVEITAANGVLNISGHQRPLAQEGLRPVWQEVRAT